MASPFEGNATVLQKNEQAGFSASLKFFTAKMFPKRKQWLMTRERDWFDQVEGIRQETGLEDMLVGRYLIPQMVL